MSYNRTFWENGITPINADNLNNLEEGVFANAEALSSVSEDMSALTEEVGTKAQQADLEAIETTVGTLETDVESLEANVGALGDRVTVLEAGSGSGGGGELPTGLLYQADVVNNLLSTATNLPLSANQGRLLKEELDDCFQSVSNGKALVASAITDKGISTDATATFLTMASNIEQLSSSPGYYDSKIVSGSFDDGTFTQHTVTCSLALEANKTYIIDIGCSICLNSNGGSLGVNFGTSWNNVTFPTGATATLLHENNTSHRIHRIYKVDTSDAGDVVAVSNVTGYYTKVYNLEITALA